VLDDEIAAACTGGVPAPDLDGVRRRTRALTGRCQGFYCAAEVARLTAQATKRSPADLLGVPR
jgi:glycerol-3-phosphate dehydrogenase